MKTAEKIIIASVVGTTFMTLYSYLRAKRENQEYVEPVLINKLIDNSENLTEIADTHSHFSGWALHYATGISFTTAYYLLWKKVLNKPTLPRVLTVGALSGLTGIAVWKVLFTQHHRPPQNYRHGYYRQLFFAHIIFSVFALTTYKALENQESNAD